MKELLFYYTASLYQELPSN